MPREGEEGPKVRAGLEAALREAGLTGRLAVGTGRPSPWVLTADPGIVRNTVGEAYGQLVAEGWLTARQGSGTRVADAAPAVAAAATSPAHARHECQRIRFDPTVRRRRRCNGRLGAFFERI